MTSTHRFIAVAASAATLFLTLTAAPLRAVAQEHVQQAGEFTVLASTVSAADLPDAMRKKYAIRKGRGTGVLNVTVQRKSDGVQRNVAAKVDVQARNLLGVETEVKLREIVANDQVSYLGVYRFPPSEVLDFRVIARPQGAPQPITLEFRHTLGER